MLDLAGSIRRRWRRLRQLLVPRPVDFIYAPGYALEIPGVLHDAQRGARVLSFLIDEGLLRESAVHAPRPVSLKLLQRVHTAEYLDSLHDRDALARMLGFSVDGRLQDSILDLQRLMAGGTRTAVRLALSGGGVAINLGGGFHHAFAGRGERFCVFNDVAAAIVDARQRGLSGRVLVVDLDLHDGDGTRQIFADDESVHTFSIHNVTSRPWAGEEGEAGEEGDGEVPPAAPKAATVIELPDGTGDELYLDTLRDRLPPVFEEVSPELVIYLAGSDPAADDALGNWRLSAEGMLERDRLVVELANATPKEASEAPEEGNDRGEGGGSGEGGDTAGGGPERFRSLSTAGGQVPLAVVLAGGYGNDAWRYTARFGAWLLSGRVVDPPTTDALMLAGYRRMARRLEPAELTAEAADPDDWGLSEEDVLSALGGVPRRTRFLGYYSRHGIELTLERAGLLDRLRAMGYEHPWLEADLDGGTGDTLRLFGGPGRTHLLMELRAALDSTSVRGYEMLRVEWLLLQNPRREFSADRPRLPGQKYPGLGFLRDVVALLILVCDRLELDGLFFVPSHFHLAAQSAKYLRFLEPEREALFRAITRAVGHLGLREATRAVAEGRLRDADDRPVEWEPVPMVMPVSDRLEKRIYGEDYERAVAERLDRYELSLVEAAG